MIRERGNGHGSMSVVTKIADQSVEESFAALTSTGGDFSGTLFREDWQLKWDPKTEPALIEQNRYGDTVENAALNRLREAIAAAAASAGATCDRLLRAVDMDLPNLVQVGNEITNGLLWPDGDLRHLDQLADLLKAGIAAARDVDPNIKIVLHHDRCCHCHRGRGQLATRSSVEHFEIERRPCAHVARRLERQHAGARFGDCDRPGLRVEAIA